MEALYDLLEEGQYKVGDMLPPEDVLARQLGVSRSTLREAMGHLEKDGVVRRRQGVGTFVAVRSKARISGGMEQLQSFRSLAEMADLKAETVQRRVSTVAARADWAAVLKVPVGSELARVQVVEAIEGNRGAYLDGLIPSVLVDYDDLCHSEGSLLEYLVERDALLPSYTRSEIYALNAGQELAGQLGVAEGQAVLHLVETYYSQSHQPMALNLNYFLTDCLSFVLFRRVVRSRRSYGSDRSEGGAARQPSDTSPQ